MARVPLMARDTTFWARHRSKRFAFYLKITKFTKILPSNGGEPALQDLYAAIPARCAGGKSQKSRHYIHAAFSCACINSAMLKSSEFRN